MSAPAVYLCGRDGTKTNFAELEFCRVSGSADGGQRRLRSQERRLINRCPFD